MGLDLTPIGLLETVTQDEKLRDAHVQASLEMVKNYHGRWYKDTSFVGDPFPENHFFEWLNTVGPRIIHDNPRVFAQSRRSGVDETVPLAIASGLNWVAQEIDLYTTLHRVFIDCCFSYGVVLTSYEPLRGQRESGDKGAMIPRNTRIAPHRWFVDRYCDFYDPANKEGRYAGHVWKKSKDELLADPRYNKEIVERIASDADLKAWGKSYDADRDEIVCREVWIPEATAPGYEDDPNVNGAVYTLATATNVSGNNVEPGWIRDPRPFYGPAWGPYTLFGQAIVPGDPYPLSVFAATYDQVKELNEHATAAARSAKRHKRFTLVDALHKGDGVVVRDAEDGGVYTVENLKDAITEVVQGGVTKEQYEYISTLRERRDRVTGLDDNARGQIDADASATAVADAASQRDARIAALARSFNEATRGVLYTDAYYLFTEELSVFPLDRDAALQFVPRPKYLPAEEDAEDIAMSTGMDVEEVRKALKWNPRVIFAGGPSEQPITKIVGDDGEDLYLVSANSGGMRFEDLALEIESGSMERTDNALNQKRIIELMDRQASIAQLLAQQGMVPNFEETFDMLGQAMNMRDLGRRLFKRIPQQPMMPQQAMPSTDPAMQQPMAGNEYGAAAQVA